MKTGVITAVVFMLFAGVVSAAPTCYTCQNGCMSSIMFQYKNCASSSTGACDAFDDCPYWGPVAANMSEPGLRVSCKYRQQWDLVRSETFSGMQEATRTEWRLMSARVQPAVASAP